MEITPVEDDRRVGVGPAAAGRGEQLGGPGEVTETIYEDSIPAFTATELERLYESIYSTLARLNIFDDLRNPGTYVERTGGRMTSVLLFQRRNGIARVLNQQVFISGDTLARFARSIFSRYPEIHQISLYAIGTALRRFRFPYQRYPAIEENIVALPATVEEYVASLSSSFRKKLRNDGNKVRQKIPGFHFEILSHAGVTEASVRAIIRLAGARMASRRKASYIGEENVARLMQMIQAYGYVGVASVNGHVCAGIVWYGVGRRFFMEVVAHDPTLDTYGLGNQMVFLAICNAVERGGSECWLMGGGRAHKSRFGAVPKYFDSVAIYRSRLRYLLDLRLVAARAVRKLAQRGKERLGAVAQGEGWAAPSAQTVLALLRAVKQWARRTGAAPR